MTYPYLCAYLSHYKYTMEIPQFTTSCNYSTIFKGDNFFMNKDLETIKEKIHTINPDITDELLDLLYEYIMQKHVICFEEKIKDKTLQNTLNYLVNPLN